MMLGGTFEVGQYFMWQGRVGQIRLFDDDLVVVKRQDDESIQTFKPEELRAAHATQQLIFSKPITPPRISMRPTTKQALIIARRQAYVSELAKHAHPFAKGIIESVIDKVTKELNEEKSPGNSTVGKWYKRWLADGRDITIQVIYKNKKRRSRLSPEILRLMEQYITKYYLKPNKSTSISAYEKFKTAYEECGYAEKVPDLSTFRRRIRKIPPVKIAEGRFGRSEARAQARVAGEVIMPEAPLDQVEMDVGHFNIGLLNDEGHYVGKASVYIIIDVFSRAILGFAIHVGKQSESQGCVIHALRYAISVKGSPDYPMYGLFREISMDGSTAFRGGMTMNFLNNICDNPQIEPTHMGWAKPFVERFIQTMRTKFFQELDGYLGKYDPSRYSDDTLAKSAKHTVEQFRDMLTHFIVYEYHHTPHSGLNKKTPFIAWSEGIKFVPPIAPYEVEDKAKLRGLLKPSVLQHVLGVTPLYQRFNSRELQALYHELLTEQKTSEIQVDVYVDPLDARAVSVVDPRSGVMLEVPNVRARAMPDIISFAELNAGHYAERLAQQVPTTCSGTARVVGGRKKPRRGREVPITAGVNFDPERMFAQEPKQTSPSPKKNSDTQKYGYYDEDEEEGYGAII